MNTSAVKRKLNTLNVQGKLKLIEFVEANPTRTWKDLAAEKKNTRFNSFTYPIAEV